MFHQRNPGQMTALPIPNSAFPPAEQVAPRIGARAVCEALVREGVTTIFGYPGGTVLPIYDVLREFPLRHILVRHEQGGAHAADGYSRATGGVGVAIATSRTRRHQPRHRPRHRHDGQRPDGRHHRQRPQGPAGQGRLPGDRYRRHRAAGHQVRDRGHGPRRGPVRRGRGVRDRPQRAARTGAARLPEGRAAARDIGPLSGALPAAAARPAAANARRRARGGRPGRDDRGRRAAADPERPRRADRRSRGPAAAGRGALRDPRGAHAAGHRQHGRDASAVRRLRRACTAGCTSTR